MDREPFLDREMGHAEGLGWSDIPIAKYTSRFEPAANAEQSIREWILRTTGPEVWNGSEIASLVVSPTRVKVYHNAEVRDKVNELLGRFLHYAPGEFDCQLFILEADDPNWRSEFLGRMRNVSRNEAGRQAWLIDRTDVRRLVERPSGVPLAHPRFAVANGQPATVEYVDGVTGIRNVVLDPSSGGSMNIAYRSETAASQDDVIVRFSPLIARDAGTIELDLEIAARKLASAERVTLNVLGAPEIDVVERQTFETKGRFEVPPGKALLLSLGLMSSFQPADARALSSRRDRKVELLVLIDLTPTTGTPSAGLGVASRRSAADVHATRRVANRVDYAIPTRSLSPVRSGPRSFPDRLVGPAF